MVIIVRDAWMLANDIRGEILGNGALSRVFAEVTRRIRGQTNAMWATLF
jgi:hypothetical protein